MKTNNTIKTVLVAYFKAILPYLTSQANIAHNYACRGDVVDALARLR